MPDSIKIAVLDDYQHNAESYANWSSLEPAAKTVFFHDNVSDINQLAARLEPFSVVVLIRERTRFGADLIGRLPNLKLILTFGMANASIDLGAAKAHNVVVSGTDGRDMEATPILTWALILGITRNLYAESASVSAGGWQVGIGVDLPGKTLGLLGLGRIGQVMARYAAAFKMRAIAWSQNLTADKAAQHGAEWVEKDDLFRQADILSIHVRLGDRTRDLVGEHELSLMKPTAYLVNTSRGPIVSEPALIAALQTGKVKGAALDVFDKEPLSLNHPFRFLPNVLATPHIGYVTENYYADSFQQIVENIAAWLKGKPRRVIA
ncbi:MAG: D-2-hydroxyacid dehydrogenase family protein [Verrucomicrobia bacterium]|nr:D-2-hydroxyacid dehydrogenase family protein [Verrucomicrobiota bacterium]MBV8482248.1 D-2-hydroxyacid dehydrogenase family protein [Verrucomicrobiota bacterium]